MLNKICSAKIRNFGLLSEIKKGHKFRPWIICRGDLTRTDDPLHPMQVR